MSPHVVMPRPTLRGAAAATRWIRAVNVEFAALLALLVLFNWPYLAGTFIPWHDTMYVFQVFHLFYGEWLLHGQLAHWIPYGTYGLESDLYQLVILTPMSYVAAVAGRLLRVSDSLLLFKLSVLAEQMLYLLGMYLLSRRLFSRRSTVVMVCLAAIGSIVWYSQIAFNFRIFYLFPLAAYCLITFLTAHRPRFFWFAAITCVAWVVGNVTYFVPLWLLALSIIGVVFSVRNTGAWRSLISRSRESLWPAALLVAVAGAYGYHLAHAADFTTIMSPGRDPDTGAVWVGSFLTYGGRADLGAVIKGLMFGWPTHLPWGAPGDNTVYAGLLCVGCAVWAVARVRTVPFFAMTGALVALIWLSFGGLFATLLYYVFPTMSHYRHVGLVYGLAKTLLILCAGFGWEAWWSTPSHGGRGSGSTPGRVRGVLAALLVMWLLVDVFAAASAFDMKAALPHVHWDIGALAAGSRSNGAQMWPAIVLWRIAMYTGLVLVAALAGRFVRRYGAGRRRTPPWAAGGTLVRGALILGLLIDLCSYQLVVYGQAPGLASSDADTLEVLSVGELRYQEQRTHEPAGDRQQRVKRLLTRPGTLAVYAFAYNLMQFDPCTPAFRADWRPSGVTKLLQIRAGDAALQRVMGCESPKLRLVSQAVLAYTVDEAEQIIRETADLDQVVVLRGIDRGDLPGAVAVPDAGPAGHLSVGRFTANELTVEADVTAEDGAWLVYADSFHPGWRVTVNGERRDVAEAYLAFKAVRLDEGHSVVRFFFGNGWGWIRSYVTALSGVVLGLLLLGLCVRTLFRPWPTGRAATGERPMSPGETSRV